MTWTEFTKALLVHFGPTEFEDFSEDFTRLWQTTTVDVYQKSFEKLSHRVDSLLKTFLIGCFVARLKDEIQLDVKMKQAQSLAKVIGVLQLVEERNSLQQ